MIGVNGSILYEISLSDLYCFDHCTSMWNITSYRRFDELGLNTGGILYFVADLLGLTLN